MNTKVSHVTVASGKCTMCMCFIYIYEAVSTLKIAVFQNLMPFALNNLSGRRNYIQKL